MSDRDGRRALAGLAGAVFAALVVAFALVAAWQHRVAVASIDDAALERAQVVQAELLRLHRETLLQAAGALAANAGFVAYINRALGDANAGAARDVRSIKDQLDERRAGLGVDVLALLLPDGRQVAAVGDGMPDVLEPSHDERFAAALANSAPAAGFVSVGTRTWQVAYAPMIQGGVVVAVALCGRLHDFGFAREVAAISRGDYALLVPRGGRLRLAASSLYADRAAALSAALDGDANEVAERVRANVKDGDVMLPGFDAPLRLRPMTDASPGTAWLTMRAEANGPSLSWLLVPLATLFVIVLAVVSLAAWRLWRAWLGPVLALADVAEHATVDHAIAFAPRGAAPVQRIGLALNRVQTQLGRHRPAPNSPRRRSTDRS